MSVFFCGSLTALHRINTLKVFEGRGESCTWLVAGVGHMTETWRALTWFVWNECLTLTWPLDLWGEWFTAETDPSATHTPISEQVWFVNYTQQPFPINFNYTLKSQVELIFPSLTLVAGKHGICRTFITTWDRVVSVIWSVHLNKTKPDRYTKVYSIVFSLNCNRSNNKTQKTTIEVM